MSSPASATRLLSIHGRVQGVYFRESMSREALWGEGIGEWEIIKKGEPRFRNHNDSNYKHC